MTDSAVPIAKIDPQPLTTTSITSDNTLVDDTVVLVDGTALVGSQVTPMKDIKVSFKSNAPQGRIEPRR